MSNKKLQVVTGDDVEFFIRLKKDRATFPILVSDEVKAAIVSIDHDSILMAPVDQSAASSGASWGNSLIAVRIPRANTAAITVYGEALLAIQVNSGGLIQTWYGPITVVEGQIA